jgi:hypothetical protein
MIREKTVLVLGAGASMPYGYPSGKDLRKRLCELELFSGPLSKGWFQEQEIKSFCDSFQRSGMASIDAFLARRGKESTFTGRTLGEIGKHGIALALRERQDMNHLFHSHGANPSSVDQTDHWYEYLWGRICEGVNQKNIQDLKLTQLSIVTFNYDLSLEYYLIYALANSYGATPVQARDLLSSIKIVHVYGNLSGNPMTLDNNMTYSFRFLEDWRRISLDQQNIQIIDEERAGFDSSFLSAFNLLTKADRIGILGFSFDPTNMQRLFLAEVLKNRAYAASTGHEPEFPQFVATTLGMEHTEQMHYIFKPIDSAFAAIGAEWRSVYASRITESLARYEGCKSSQLLRRSGLLVQ